MRNLQFSLVNFARSQLNQYDFVHAFVTISMEDETEVILETLVECEAMGMPLASIVAMAPTKDWRWNVTSISCLKSASEQINSIVRYVCYKFIVIILFNVCIRPQFRAIFAQRDLVEGIPENALLLRKLFEKGLSVKEQEVVRSFNNMKGIQVGKLDLSEEDKVKVATLRNAYYVLYSKITERINAFLNDMYGSRDAIALLQQGVDELEISRSSDLASLCSRVRNATSSGKKMKSQPASEGKPSADEMSQISALTG